MCARWGRRSTRMHLDPRPFARGLGFRDAQASRVEGQIGVHARGGETWRFSGEPEMAKDIARDEAVGERGDQLASAAAVWAPEHVDSEDALQQLGAQGSCLIQASLTRSHQSRRR